MRFILLLILPLLACGRDPAVSKTDPTPEVAARYNAAVDRLVAMLDRGWVVSKYNDGSLEHQGDALIWSGIAMAELPCDKAQPIEDALITMIEDQNGGLFRHPSLSDKISMDGALGFYRGVVHRIKACGQMEKWSSALAKHAALPGNSLNRSSDVSLPPEFTYVRDLVFARTGNGSDPNSLRLRALETQVTSWASITVETKTPCYRLNLSYQALKTVDELGEKVNNSAFCSATKNAGLAHIDHWCGRSGMDAWLHDFTYDTWEYAHQRCTAWESPDGKPGLHTPGLDLIEVLKEGYNL